MDKDHLIELISNSLLYESKILTLLGILVILKIT